MSEFAYFYGTREDWPKLLAAALCSQCAYYVDDWYDQPHAPAYQEVTSAAMDHLAAAKRRVFIVGPFSNGPVHFEQQRSGPCTGRYWIDPTRGGATLDLIMPASFRRDELLHLQSGEFSTYSEQWDADLTTATPISTLTHSEFKAAVRRLRSECVQMQLKRKVWLAPGAHAAWLQGKARLNLNGEWLGG